MTDEIVLRASMTPEAEDCELRAIAKVARRQIEAAGFRLRRSPRAVGALVGSATHRAAQISLEEKLRSGSLPPLSVATDAAHEYLVIALNEGETLFGPPTFNRDDAAKQTLALTRLYHREVAPQIRPVHVEERLEAELAPGIVVSGQPDQVARQPDSIVDLKTGLRLRNYNAQIGTYSLLARSNGLAIKTGRIDFLKRVGTGKPQPPPATSKTPLLLAEERARDILHRLARDWIAFRDGSAERRLGRHDPRAFSANPHSILCSRKYCPAHGTEFCQAWRLNEQ